MSRLPWSRRTWFGRPSDHVDLTATVGNLVLPNPVMTASGTSGHGVELAAYVDLSELGAVVVKSLSPEPWAGNPAPRVLAARAGMLNSIGLQNPGVERWLDRDLPALASARARVVASIWGFTADDYGRAAKALAASAAAAGAAVPAGRRADGRNHNRNRGPEAAAMVAAEAAAMVAAETAAMVAVEANVSCPNLEDGPRMFAQSAAATAAAIEAAARGLAGTGLPLWAKLSPTVTDITEIAGAALQAGADGLTLVNTLAALAIDPATGQPWLGAGGGGLSGPALHPVAVRAVYDCRRAFPAAAIVGVGGVSTGEDAAELLAAGADAVQVGTATFADPRAPARVLAELEQWCREHHVDRVAGLKGRAHGS